MYEQLCVFQREAGSWTRDEFTNSRAHSDRAHAWNGRSGWLVGLFCLTSLWWLLGGLDVLYAGPPSSESWHFIPHVHSTLSRLWAFAGKHCTEADERSLRSNLCSPKSACLWRRWTCALKGILWACVRLSKGCTCSGEKDLLLTLCQGGLQEHPRCLCLYTLEFELKR